MNQRTDEPDDGLSPAARAAMAALRGADDIPDDARARVWQRLSAAPAADLSDMSVRTAAKATPWTGVVVGLAIAAGVVLALVELGGGAEQVVHAPRGDAAVYDSGASERLSARPAAPAPTSATIPEPEVAPAVVASPPAPRRGRERAPVIEPVPGDSSTLAEETALVQRAQVEIAGGDPEAALARLAEHARRFADGVLARERDVLRVTALCAAGRVEAGRAEAAAFLRAHPGSLLAERVQTACESP